MRVLVVGSGAREHALCWAVAASPMLTKLWVAPGNGGTAELAETVPIDVLDLDAIVAFAKAERLDLVVPGPEAPLVAGLADRLEAIGVRCAGPSAAAARLEGEKSFTKEVADAAGIPTARYELFDDPTAARRWCQKMGAPLVVKANGLAGGKGVVVATSLAEADQAIVDLMEKRRFGGAGATVLIEECLSGPEVSAFALCDGTHAIPLGAARDYKRLRDDDLGPNTGGMGAIAPVPLFSSEIAEDVLARIIRPALAEMAHRGTPFRGVLFAGLMLTAEGPKLIEFNVRFGDPECEALLPLLASDFLGGLVAACDGELGDFDLRWEEGASVTVVLAARGYPEAPSGDGAILGLERAAALSGVEIFHGATRRVRGELRAAGGRVLTVQASGANLEEARDRAYGAAGMITWDGAFYRRDIGRPPISPSSP